MITRRTFILLIVMLFAVPTSLFAESRDEIIQRQAKRLPEISNLKQQGAIGETSEGYLDFVEARSGKSSELVNEENADRRKLYEMIAEETGATADVVAKKTAKRNFERAKKGEFLKEDGKWRKKD